MNTLVNCPCGHHLGRHADDGCSGLFRPNDCDCALTRCEALEGAIAAIRRPGPQIYFDSEFEEGITA
jgi:hypothetical protein